jgi:uncharacterized protein (TIGR03089 family)
MHTSVPSVVSALATALAGDPGRPLVTFYDGSTGERVELSVKTFDNWVNKIANLLSDQLMLEPGDAVRVELPTHWQSAVTLLGVWTAGLHVVFDGATQVPAASVVGPATTRYPDRVHGQAIACSLRPLGGPFAQSLPSGWLDFALEVPSQPDVYVGPSLVQPEHLAVVGASGRLSHRQLVARAFETASRLGLFAGGRLLTDANPCDTRTADVGLVAPLVAGCSVVLVTGCDEAARDSIASQERVTVTDWQPMHRH